MVLSICICSLYKRAGMLARILRELEIQIHELEASDKVQILVDVDDGEVSTGSKSNRLYNKAEGLYVCRVDDDDMIAPYYIREILKAIDQPGEFMPDAIAMNGTITFDGRNERKWFISKDLPYTAARDTKSYNPKQELYLRYHNHLSPVRKSIAIKFPFSDKYIHEDSDYADALNKAGAIKTEVAVGTTYPEYLKTGKILLPMYFYKFVNKK